MTDINYVSGFQLATTLQLATAQYFAPVLSSATANVRKVLNITDLKATCGPAKRSIRLVGQGGGLPVKFDLASSSAVSFSWQTPLKLYAVSTTGVTGYGIYASASGAGVKCVISGFYS